MSDELAKQLASYKAQLQQVEAALSTDADNEDLLKLQKDLQVGVLFNFNTYFQFKDKIFLVVSVHERSCFTLKEVL